MEKVRVAPESLAPMFKSKKDLYTILKYQCKLIILSLCQTLVLLNGNPILLNVFANSEVLSAENPQMSCFLPKTNLSPRKICRSQ